MANATRERERECYELLTILVVAGGIGSDDEVVASITNQIKGGQSN